MLRFGFSRRKAAIVAAAAIAVAGSVVSQTSAQAIPSDPSVVTVAPVLGTFQNPFYAPAMRVTFTDVSAAGYVAYCQRSTGGDQTFAEGTGTSDGSGNLYLDVNVTKGYSYQCQVARGSDGDGNVLSELSSSVAAYDVPSASTLSGSVTSTSVTTTWSAPFNGGSAITKYQCKKGTGSWANTSPAMSTSCNWTGLTLGQSYTLTIRAVNAIGNGVESAITLTTSSAPNPPTTVTVANGASTLSNGKLDVSFSGATAQGSAITGYTAECTSSNGGTTGSNTGSSSPITVSNLTLGKSYTCRVKATDAVSGYGGFSSASSAAVPVAVPATPSITGVVASSSTATVSFTLSQVSNGGTTQYSYSYDGVTYTNVDPGFAGTTGTFVTSESRGDFASLRVRATNSAGSATSGQWNSTSVLSGAGSYQCGTSSSLNLSWSGKWKTALVDLGPLASGTVTNTAVRCDVTKNQIDEISKDMLATYASWNQGVPNGSVGDWRTATSNFAVGTKMRVTSTVLTGGAKGKPSVGGGNANIYVEGTVGAGGNWSWKPYGSSSGDSVNIQISTDGGSTWTTLWVLTVSL